MVHTKPAQTWPGIPARSPLSAHGSPCRQTNHITNPATAVADNVTDQATRLADTAPVSAVECPGRYQSCPSDHRKFACRTEDCHLRRAADQAADAPHRHFCRHISTTGRFA
ncbi:hypothetical protein Lesp02_15670 [Lentzea sp. NBRC 105346]|nr:hypothetical protein Lesp02_15670 [Lentzea sp. NBRC 105346]